MTERKAGTMSAPATLVQAFLGGIPDDLGLDVPTHDQPRFFARVSHRMARHIPVRSLAIADAGPMVSFTFDDVPESAHSAGANLLEEHDTHGTFYVAGSLLGEVTRDWRVIDGDGVCDLAARGHEIGCHTFAHLRADQMAPSRVATDILRNRTVLCGIEPSLALDNFAYPFGYGAFGWKRELAKIFRTGRGIVPGVQIGRIDTQFLRAVPLMDERLDANTIDRLLDKTCEKRGWLVFYSHDVTARPSEYGCSPKLLIHALRAATARGIARVSVAQAMARITA